MQIREDSFKGDRPPCPKRGPNCKNKPHCNGHYLRYANPDESQPSLKIFCFWCVPCRVSISVIPVNHLPYWSIEVDPLVHIPTISDTDSGLYRTAFRRISDTLSERSDAVVFLHRFLPVFCQVLMLFLTLFGASF